MNTQSARCLTSPSHAAEKTRCGVPFHEHPTDQLDQEHRFVSDEKVCRNAQRPHVVHTLAKQRAAHGLSDCSYKNADTKKLRARWTMKLTTSCRITCSR